ncbi:nucleotidyltransferase family protein [Evansella cellulosilytica]|uniref:Nucleotidyltransferase family protein n=1 Tax=Evansella cellulosilytica (strain ATCC 21833 / DSM 2522 / FERM P-1141 / JCM 9156 / N-4) TaxID=649639 RepID=E6TYF2_EVAC2|nr:nucleotidyltransferase family protein [Evansella cellulosilytica]ADU28890.1 protein of unknown function DUF925 [Evansella cellulosilytica DSM 2522]
MLISEDDIIYIIKKDKEMMHILETVETLKLPDWWVCAGFVRAKIWDTLHGYTTSTKIPDVDVIYFDQGNIEEKYEKRLEKDLFSIHPRVPWSVKNEARMHKVNNLPPYTSSVDAISKFPETATALGVKLDKKGNVILTAPCGIQDVINLEVKPTTFFTMTEERAAIYNDRIAKKNWRSLWPKVKVHYI